MGRKQPKAAKDSSDAAVEKGNREGTGRQKREMELGESRLRNVRSGKPRLGHNRWRHTHG